VSVNIVDELIYGCILSQHYSLCENAGVSNPCRLPGLVNSTCITVDSHMDPTHTQQHLNAGIATQASLQTLEFCYTLVAYHVTVGRSYSGPNHDYLVSFSVNEHGQPTAHRGPFAAF